MGVVSPTGMDVIDIVVVLITSTVLPVVDAYMDGVHSGVVVVVGAGVGGAGVGG